MGRPCSGAALTGAPREQETTPYAGLSESRMDCTLAGDAPGLVSTELSTDLSALSCHQPSWSGAETPLQY